jgi:hypothetical protein
MEKNEAFDLANLKQCQYQSGPRAGQVAWLCEPCLGEYKDIVCTTVDMNLIPEPAQVVEK